MANWNELLDRIVARKHVLPSHAEILRLPSIDGWEPGRVWCTWKVDPDFIQPHGSLFGGYISAVADEMIGMATISVLADGEAFATSECHVRYLRPIRDGNLEIEAKVLRRSRSVAHVEATFTASDGDLVAKASGTQVIRTAER